MVRHLPIERNHTSSCRRPPDCSANNLGRSRSGRRRLRSGKPSPDATFNLTSLSLCKLNGTSLRGALSKFHVLEEFIEGFSVFRDSRQGVRDGDDDVVAEALEALGTLKIEGGESYGDEVDAVVLCCERMDDLAEM